MDNRIIGAQYLGNDRCSFSVWAPEKKSMVLHIVFPEEQRANMVKDEEGYFSITLNDIAPGTRYFYMPDGRKDFPDPASHYQPEGVHGPSEVVDHASFKWRDKHWRGLPFRKLIFYELHVGTFTDEGTFQSIISRLDELVETGINAIEMMPVSQFPGNRNWGYDGVYPYSVQNSYGGPDGLKKLVDACHDKGIAVFLDVVCNHIGPEGNYFSHFGPYFTDQYSTPWGDAINFDGSWSDGVREYFSSNILFWFQHYHLDGLRLDAIHMVFDNGAVNFWELVSARTEQLQQHLGRTLYLVAESDLNSPRVVRHPDAGGFGFTAQWLDDFHHALYVLLDKKGRERYIDFGSIEQLAKAFTDGFVHSGEYVKFRKRKHGASSAGIPGDRFIVFNMNHDQVGNRVRGERLCMLVDHERQKIAAAALMFSPYIPMLFMGEEYADESPFFYFVSHTDAALVEAVRKGRKEEFKDFKSEGEAPDPQDESTFTVSRLKWSKRSEGRHGIILRWHKRLIELRNTHPVLQNYSKNDIRVYIINSSAFVLHRQSEEGRQHLLIIFNFSEERIPYTLAINPTEKSWSKILDSTEPEWSAVNARSLQRIPEENIVGKELTLDPLSVVVLQNTSG